MGTYQLSFSELPAEIRLLIWSYYAVAAPGIVMVTRAKKHLLLEGSFDVSTVRRIGGPPFPLQVCHDSRVAALQHYRLMFTAVDGRGVWFDPVRDTLDSRNASSYWYLEYPNIRADLALVQNLILRPLVITGSTFRFRYLQRFPNLQRLALLRDADLMRALNYSVAVHDTRGRTQLEAYWYKNMPGSPVPLLLFLTEEPSLLVLEQVMRSMSAAGRDMRSFQFHF